MWNKWIFPLSSLKNIWVIFWAIKMVKWCTFLTIFCFSKYTKQLWRYGVKSHTLWRTEGVLLPEVLRLLSQFLSQFRKYLVLGIKNYLFGVFIKRNLRNVTVWSTKCKIYYRYEGRYIQFSILRSCQLYRRQHMYRRWDSTNKFLGEL